MMSTAGSGAGVRSVPGPAAVRDIGLGSEPQTGTGRSHRARGERPAGRRLARTGRGRSSARPARAVGAAVVGVLALVLAACGGPTGTAPSSAPAGGSAVPSGSPTAPRSATPAPGRAAPGTPGALPLWPTYHGDPARSGHVATSPPLPLAPGWTARLDGAVYGEPLVVGGLLIVATEADSVYGLVAETGAVRWHTSLGRPEAGSGLPCGDIDPLGVTGTPAYDAATGSVFVAREATGGSHDLFALDAATGAVRWHRNLDTQRGRDRLAEQQRAALLVTTGRVLVAFGGLFGDCGNYVGYVVSVPTDGRGAVASYAVPTARAAGMWAPPGPVLGPGGLVYVASGNGAAVAGGWDRSDSVTALDPVTLHPRAVFAPASWPADNAADLDLGSMSPAVVPAAGRLISAGKRGVVYLLAPSLRGVGGQVAQLPGCRAFGGAAVAGTTVVLPCAGGLRALRVSASGLTWSWTAAGVFGSPVVAGRQVFVADRASGDLDILRLSDGAVLQRLPAGNLTHFPSEAVSGDWVFVPTLGGVTAFRGRPAGS